MAVSVIIPTLNEEGCIAAAIRNVRAQNPREIIVVDGGSDDGTVQQARQADLILSSPRGRARQMNTGAGRTSGTTLLFLHADCTLEDGALSRAEHALTRRRIVAGCFAMQVPESGWLYRSIDACASLRVRLTGLVYGDQGLFLRHDTFTGLGGFPELRFMEDVFLSMRLRNLGKIVVVSRKIFVSSRRWQKVGLIRQTLRNWTLTALATGGIHPDRLARYYPVIR
jgi:rSAM/selenodomain-associated transferase 2